MCIIRSIIIDNKEKARLYYKKNKEKISEQRKLRASRTKDNRKKEGQLFRIKNPEYSLWLSAKNNSSTKSREFTLKVEDIVIPEFCPYLGIALTNTQGSGRVWTNISLDRIDSTKGYTPDNIQVISLLANCMKQHATTEQLVSFAKGVLKLHGDS